MLTLATDPRAELETLLRRLVPQGLPLPRVQVPLADDECRWLLAGLGAGLFSFRECRARCPRFQRAGVPGPDEFLASNGGERHLYSSPGGPGLRLNREYIPHLAAHARAVLQVGCDPRHADFSRYEQFTQDRITKKRGHPYEIDSLFRTRAGKPYLHAEVKTSPREVERIAAAIDRFAELTAMPTSVVKEIEYVLELAPEYLWLVGPGTVEPEAHVWRVWVDGCRARFERRAHLPDPPRDEAADVPSPEQPVRSEAGNASPSSGPVDHQRSFTEFKPAAGLPAQAAPPR